MFRKIIPLSVLLVSGSLSFTCQANLLGNGDFESGTLAGWTTFVTGNGDLGSGAGLPDVALFDVTGSGQPSQAARFEVGEKVYNGATGHTSQGGGFFTDFTSPSGQYSITADLAAENLSGYINISPGTFNLYLDGTLLASRDFGALFGWIYPSQVQRASISAAVQLAAGPHELRFLMTRPALNSDTPFQFVDNVQVTLVPEPGLTLPAGLLGAALFLRWRRTT